MEDHELELEKEHDEIFELIYSHLIKRVNNDLLDNETLLVKIILKLDG